MSVSAQRQPAADRHPNLVRLDAVRAAARQARMRAFLDYYASMHPAGRLPARGDFDPLHIPRLLPHLMLVDVDRSSTAGLRFRVRVAGEYVTAATLPALAGRWLDEIDPAEYDTAVMIAARRSVAESGLLDHGYGRSAARFRLDFANLEYAHCPLAEDGETVSHILSFYQSEAFLRAD
ncbi:PAS domain-containing protein [Ferrovibrio sp.]|uniref:PAS domain-containing protein n=1 Tax=Ferrovibrio sp. TaxID=1917215 RepID=UPI00311E4802